VWGGARKLVIPMLFVFTCGIAGSSYAMFMFVMDVHALPFHISYGCILRIGNDDAWIDLAILLLSESLALGILLSKSIVHARGMRNLQYNMSRRSSILSVMARYGIGYFVCSVAITTTNLVILRTVTPNLRAFLLVSQSSVQNIMCSRLLFHTFSMTESSEFVSSGHGSVPETALSSLEIASRGRSDELSETCENEYELRLVDTDAIVQEDR